MDVKGFFSRGNKRSLLIKKNIIASFVFRAVSVLVSLLLVPLSIGFLSVDKYGLWLTLSSIISWMAFFDFGLAHGFRNCFAKSVANEDFKLAKSYVSTAYFVIACIFTTLMFVTLFINSFIDWTRILNISAEYTLEIRTVVQVMIVSFCIKNVVNIFCIMMNGYQRPAVSLGVVALSDVFVLFLVYIVTLVSEQNMPLLAFIMSFVPCCIILLVSIIVFSRDDYKKFRPDIRCINLSLTKNIIGIGVQFFIIMMAMMFIFQFTNIIITRELGPSSVSLYNVTYKLFNVVVVVMTVVLNPFWSAFTDAYTKGDYSWMKNSFKKVEKLGLLTIPVIILLLFASEFIFDIWLGDKMETDFALTAVMSLYAVCRIMGQVYMYPLNGIGKIRLQLITYIIFAVIAIPTITFCTRMWGVIGAIIVPILTFLIQCVVNRVQLLKILNNRAKGIWDK